VIWTEYIALADELGHRDSEAARRSAVSCAYYGAFNLARRWLEGQIGPVDNRAVHRKVWDTFRQPDLATADTWTTWERIGELGDYLRALRNQADYDDTLPDLGRHATEAVAGARRILALLPELELAG
jgi:hypothetical protein